MKQVIKKALRTKAWKALTWIQVFSIVTIAVALGYGWFAFKELDELMQQTPLYQPTLIYSDLYILQKNTLYSNSFLTERLKDRQIPFEIKKENGSSHIQVQWQSRSFNYPESLLATDSELRIASDLPISVLVADDHVTDITIDGKPTEAFALEPDVVAQISGAHKSIREYLKLDDIPTLLKEAIISVEDQRFREHFGFDVKSVARAAWTNLKHRSMAQGGSTITQQLVKNLLNERHKTFVRKFKELILAILMEARYEKEKILEKYLNEVYFGQIGALEVHGVAEAAKYFFGKSLSKLSIAEMAFIAGVIRGPAVYSPYKYPERALTRKNVVLKKLLEQHYIAQTEYNNALKEKLFFIPPDQSRNQAPYFVDYAKAQILDQLKDKITEEDLQNQGLKIYTTLDLPLQRRASTAVASVVKELEQTHKITAPLRLEGLLAATHPQNGFIRALVGGRSYNETTFNRVLNMKRPVGSTFKPVAYLAAFLKGHDTQGIPYSPDYFIEDSPFTYNYEGGQSWTPHNYENNYRGRITLREAFINSINIPMAKIGLDVGLDHIIETAQKLGIRTKLSAIPSLTLGTVDLNAVELLQTYSTITTKGTRTDLTAVRVVTDKEGQVLAHFEPKTEKIFETEAMDTLHELLRSVVLEGTAKSMVKLGYTKTAYGKTGTTSFYRDSWFAGFSQGLTTIAWIGFDEVKATDKIPFNLTGASGALPLWARFYIKSFPSLHEEGP